MSAVTDLLDQVKEAHGLESDSDLGRALGVKRQTVSNWRNGHAAPDAVACATIAGLLGMPLAKVIGIAGEARAITKQEKAVWKKLASAVAIVLALGAYSLPIQALAASSSAYYVKRRRRQAATGTLFA